MTAVIVLSKAPVAGRSKTRLCPPCTPDEAARLAEAALVDTLDAVAACSAPRTVLALEGEPGSWMRQEFDVVTQRGDGLAGRLAAAFADVGGPALLVGMDTPQVTPELLDTAIARLRDHDAVLGEALDGGYWAIGLQRPRADVFSGIPMSTKITGLRQRERLDALGLTHAALPPLRDVDRFDDALAVAGAAPWTRFAAATQNVATRIEQIATTP